MGIVVDVTRDENGDVTSLRMYHGRNPDKGSGITSLQWAYSGNSDYPPFGVGPQYLVAVSTVAPVITP